jgi:hypothetical protein
MRCRLGDRDHAFRHEAGEIVDMAVGMVVEQAAAEPQQPIDAEMVGEPRLNVGAREIGVAIGIEQALLGGDGKPGAVDIDRAAFEDPVGMADGEARGLRQADGEIVVARQVIFAAPAVEAEIEIGPVSRSQMSPNGWRSTSMPGPAMAAAASADSSSAATRTTRSPAPSRTARAKSTTSLRAGARSSSQRSGWLGKPIHTHS